MEELSHTKMKNCEYLGKAISSPLMLGGRYTPRQWSCFQKFLSHQKWWSFLKFLQNTKMLIPRKLLDGANPTKFLTCWISLQSTHANFQNIFVSPNIAAILNFWIFCKNCKTHKCLYLENCARAECADFGCHNSIRLETEHFLNTLAVTFISFSGRFVFAMQKHFLFFLRAIL